MIYWFFGWFRTAEKRRSNRTYRFSRVFSRQLVTKSGHKNLRFHQPTRGDEMARIRSIKPEFWSDEKVAQMSHGCMAFFIGLWNFCDDEGKCEDNASQLALRMPVFRREDIARWIKNLVALGLLQRGSLAAHERLASGSPAAWLRVTNWSHQRIDRPRLPKIKMDEITWVLEIDSSNDRESSSNVRRKDRIGSDRIGSDRISSAGVQDAPPAADKNQSNLFPIVTDKNANRGANKRVWEAYFDAYMKRYGVEPVRNAKVNANVAQFVARLGVEDAVEVAKFFVHHNDSYYLKNTHSFSLALRDAEALRTQWARGRAITTADLRRFERHSEQAAILKAIDDGEV